MKNTLSISLVGSIVILLILQSCSYAHKDKVLGNSGICDTTNTKFATVIQPMMTTYCNTQSGCHGGSNLGSISLEGYDNIKDNYSSILTRINSGNMPKGSPKLDDCSIQKVQTWVNRGAQNN